VPS
jgi:hypothetical protein